jgi:hypothetical protein
MFPSNNGTPVHRLLGTLPNYSSLRVDGCACWSNLGAYNKRKLDLHSKQSVFLAYGIHHKGVKCLKVSTGRVHNSYDVGFDEIIFPFKNLHPNVGVFRMKKSYFLILHFGSLRTGRNY